MPDRSAKKPRKAAPGREKKSAPTRAGRAVDTHGGVAELRAERDRLEVELAAARARIEDLETARNQVLDRIAWMVDSLHNLLEDQN